MIGTRSATQPGHERLSGVPQVNDVQLMLPAGGELFISHGVPQLFRRFELSSDRRFESSWLYLPDAALAAMSEAKPVDQPGVRIGTTFPMEEFDLIPIISGSDLCAVFAMPNAQRVQLTSDQLMSIGQFLQPSSDDSIDPLSVALEFITELYHRDSALDGFYKKLLSLVVDCWPRSSAAVYVETPESYQLRLVVGDVTRCHFFQTELKPDLAAAIQSALVHNSRVIPVDTMPDVPTFLSMAPDFFFVHEAVKSERANQLLLVVGSGDVEENTVQYLKTIGRLTSGLHEAQFATPTEFLELYSKLTDHSLGLGLMESACRVTYELISRQIGISRITLYRLDAKGDFANSWSATGERGTKATVAESRDTILTDSIRARLSASPEPIHIGDLANGTITSSEAKRMYMENIRSLYILPIKSRRGTVGYLEVCSPLAGPYLTRFEHLFEVAAGYIGSVVALEELSDQRIIPADESTPDCRNAQRLTSIRKLVDGFLHGFSSRVAVVVGQSELLTEAAIDSARRTSSGRSGMEKIALAANELATRIGSLRAIVDLVEAPPNGSIDGSAFLADLPNILEGFGRKIKDTRNVEIPISYSAATRQSFKLRAEDTIDVVVPFLMSVMEYAICSGTIAVQGSAKGIIPVLGIQYKRNLLGYTSMESLITRVFPNAIVESTEESEGTAQISGCALAYRLLNDDTYHVSLMCGAPSKLAANQTNPATPGKY
ncbi:MAG: GAF domain-containing protein [Candidatus Zixiibacteriota bacterium]